VYVGGKRIFQDMSGPFRVGVGLTQTTGPSKPPAPAAEPRQDAFPWLWALAAAAIAAALLMLGLRGRRRWRPA
jgi:hypothetical protein